MFVLPPAEWDSNICKGIVVGRCIDNRNNLPKVQAHAHIKRCGLEYFSTGWICTPLVQFVGVITLQNWGSWSGRLKKPTQTMLHEYAHLLTNHGHDAIFRRMLKEIGGLKNHKHIWRFLTLRSTSTPVTRCIECGLTYRR